MSTAIERALVEALAWLVMAIDETGDEVDPDLAVRWFEDTGLPLDGLAPTDRKALAQLCRQRAAEVDDPLMREALLAFPRVFDLSNE
jgi:hypothetical protein